MGPPDATPPAPPHAAAADEAALPAGYAIHEYRIEKTLGGGGFGITYLARDDNLNLPVAIKEYFPSDLAVRGTGHTVHIRSGNEDNRGTFEWGLERFLDEARALATFRHANIVRVLRYFRENGTAYIVMEYESGLSLKKWVPQHAPLSQRSLLGIVLPLLEGLEQVHGAGFLHRDIKPDNIYVRADNSPVLLDFGSARRMSGNKELTNIVSPGFAPFEQYHSQGHQGPWTDIYSIGAVMYWMVTGRKPVESAARVKTDEMVPAAELADDSVYGAALLAAIDWALQPEEGRRPQSVAEFRSSVDGAATLDVVLPDDGNRTDTRALPKGAVRALEPASTTVPGPQAKRTLLCTILFLDMVGYSVRSVDDQQAIRKMFKDLLGKALRGVPEETRIAIDTGDGAAICFMGDPEEALRSTLLLRDLLGQRQGKAFALRLGLHMGPVRVVKDINERVNVIGDGINVAQRVMDFAQPNQVLVSRAYYDVISRITDDTADMFAYLGQYEDKHGRVHELYAAGSPGGAKTSTTKRTGPSTGYTQTVPVQGAALDDASAAEVEAELARHIGPLARVLVAKARPLAQSVEQLRETLAPTIQDEALRELFLSGQQGPSSHPPHSHATGGQSVAISKPRGVTQPRSGAMPSAPAKSNTMPRSALGASIPAQRAAPAAQPISTRSGSTTTRPLDLPAEEVAAMELALSKFIGPMARIVVRKEIARSATFKDLVAAMVDNVDRKDQREAFLAALHKALPRRSF